jgi:hypothetical protein
MRGLTGEELLRLPVRLRGILLGRPVDLILHPAVPRALGLDVLCGDEGHRFLPASAATVGEREIEVSSPFVLLDVSAGSLYGAQACSLSALRGMRVGNDGAVLADVVLGRAWAIEELVLDGGHGRRRVPCDGNFALPAGGGSWRATEPGSRERPGRGRRTGAAGVSNL